MTETVRETTLDVAKPKTITGVILPINLHDYKSELKTNDLIYLNESTLYGDMFFNLHKIDKRALVGDGEPDNENCYFIIDPVTNEPMNYKRSEVSKCNIGIFDACTYYESGVKILLGSILNSDMTNIKAKACLKYDIPLDAISTVTLSDLLELEFNGTIVTKEYNPDIPDLQSYIKYFKLC